MHESVAIPPVDTPWSLPKRIAFRFTFVYSLLYVLPFPLGFVGTEWAANLYRRGKFELLVLAARLVGVNYEPKSNGSGDTFANYFETAILAVISVLVAAAFTAFARRSRPDEKLHAWWRLLVRYYLAASMLTYGAIKVLKSQFPALQPSDLQITYGESSPMGMLWRMMSLSAGYCVFTGLVEVIGAVCLFWRRTTLFGALLLSAALANVVALNFFFDVPVKLGSSHLLLFALLLVLPHARRLSEFFAGRAVPAYDELRAYVSDRRRVRVGVAIAKGVFVAALIGFTGYEAHTAYRTWGDGAPLPALQGLYEVTAMEVEPGDKPAPRWHRVTIDRQGFIAFRQDGTKRGFEFAYDPEAKSMSAFTKNGDSLASVAGSTEAHPETLTLEGKLGGNATKIELRRLRSEEILLTSRGFHWVNEVSFYR